MSAGSGYRDLHAHTTSVKDRLLPHLRDRARTLRPAWVERMVAEKYPPEKRGKKARRSSR